MAPPAPTTSRRARSDAPPRGGPIPVLGLIGEIGAGKSLVARRLAEHGALVIDADAVGHAVLRRRAVRDALVARFGPAILDAGGRVDRRALGRLVFADPRALRDLEVIVHPRMRRVIERAIGRAGRRGGAPAVVLDAAILIEAGWDDLCDRIVFVEAPRDQRLARLSAQRGWDEPALAARERAQRPAAEKRARADALIVNDGGVDRLGPQVDALRELWSAPASRGRPDPIPSEMS